MLKGFSIGSYRGLKKVELKDFADINIFVGKNNAGKTSVLEAMILSGLFDDGELLIQTLISRYQQISIEFLKDLFFDNSADTPLICLKREMENPNQKVHTHITYKEEEKLLVDGDKVSQHRELRLLFDYRLDEPRKEISSNYAIIFTEKGNQMEIGMARSKEGMLEAKIPCEFISFSRFDRTNYLMNSLDEVLEQDKRGSLIEVLQLFDPQVENFEVIGKERNIKIFAKNRKQPLSLYDYGNGMYKAFYIASAALLCENGILLVDEIEAGIHKEALRKFVGFLVQICKKKNIQVFITTHSLETLDLFLEYDKTQLERIAAYNLRKVDENTFVRRYSGEKLADLRENMGLDIR